MVDLNKYLSLYVEKDESLVVHFVIGQRLWIGLSGESQPRSSHAMVDVPAAGAQDVASEAAWALQLEPLLRDAVLRGAMVAPTERKCVVALDWSAPQPCRAALARVLLEKLKCPGVVRRALAGVCVADTRAQLVVDSASAACVALGEPAAALVLQWGADELCVVPVVGAAVLALAVQLVRLSDADGVSAAAAVARALRACPLDVRALLVSRIVLLHAPPALDAAALLHNVRGQLGDTALAAHARFVKAPYSAPLPWVGASLLGATLRAAPQPDMLLRDAFLAGKRLPELSEVRAPLAQ